MHPRLPGGVAAYLSAASTASRIDPLPTLGHSGSGKSDLGRSIFGPVRLFVRRGQVSPAEEEVNLRRFIYCGLVLFALFGVTAAEAATLLGSATVSWNAGNSNDSYLT